MFKQLMTPADPAHTPASVRRAVQLMFVGAAITTVTFVLILVFLGSVKSALHTQHPNWTASQVNRQFTAFVISTVVSEVIGIALWLVMARGALNGRKWAQIISTVLFALYTITIPSLLTTGAILPLVLDLLTWLVGAGAVIMLWRPESKAFFAAR